MGNEIEKDYHNSNRPVTTILKLKILFCQNISKIIYFTISRNLEKYAFF